MKKPESISMILKNKTLVAVESGIFDKIFI
ncbi:hypothetical protein HNP24_001170 [Chryseobacterium sediminis]|uniref:Uncharacterized protein n=1 Tax=Chryseobacterium sediminis TaxID=1679494 RepID=A0ABR6PWX4_9FLAO|nr:hypothetical protein [Chryseobacterium sediminis]